MTGLGGDSGVFFDGQGTEYFQDGPVEQGDTLYWMLGVDSQARNELHTPSRKLTHYTLHSVSVGSRVR